MDIIYFSLHMSNSVQSSTISWFGRYVVKIHYESREVTFWDTKILELVSTLMLRNSEYKTVLYVVFCHATNRFIVMKKTNNKTVTFDYRDFPHHNVILIDIQSVAETCSTCSHVAKLSSENM